MPGKLDPQAQQKLAALQTMADRIQHVYGLVERFAAVRDPRQAEAMSMPLRRAFGRLKLDLNGAGLDTLSQLAAAMEIAARRGASHPTKSRILREGVGSLRFQIDMEQRKVLSDAAAEGQNESEEEGPPTDEGARPAGHSTARTTTKEAPGGSTPAEGRSSAPPSHLPASGKQTGASKPDGSSPEPEGPAAPPGSPS